MPRVKLFDEQEALEKATDLFWKQGYYATSIQDLVDHLGINRASLYDTFGGKKELFERALQWYRLSNSNGIRALLHSQEQVKEGLRSLLRMAVDQSVSTEGKGCFVVNVTTELLPNDPTIRPLLEENKAGFEQLIQDYLQTGVQKGQLATDKDLRAIAALFFTFYNGLKVVTKVDANQEQLYGTVEALLTVLD